MATICPQTTDSNHHHPAQATQSQTTQWSPLPVRQTQETRHSTDAWWEQVSVDVGPGDEYSERVTLKMIMAFSEADKEINI